MASSPVATTGMTTQAAGASGVLTGATGLDGLFAALMGGIGQTAGADGFSFMNVGQASPLTDISNTLLGDIDVSALTVLQSGMVQQTVQLGDEAPEITVTGEPEAVKAFVSQVQALYKDLVKNGLTMGKMADTNELAGALAQMGMEPDVALGVAEKIQTMLTLVEQQQGKVVGENDDEDADTQGTLAAMMLAVMAQQVQPTDATGAAAAAGTLSVQITTVEQTLVTVNVRSVFQNTDIARDIMGIGAKAPAAAPAAKTTTKIEVAVTAGEGEPTIDVALPELPAKDDAGALETPVVVKDKAVTPQATQAAQAAAMAANPMTGSKVAANEVIASPEGETVYKLQADKDGTETLTAVKPVPTDKAVEDVARPAEGRTDFQQAVLDANSKTVQTGYVENQTAQHETHKADMAAFAERVAQVNEMMDKAQVGKQVAVQIQPLLEQGGGTIKVSLNPKELGHITVELSIHEGKVTGSIAVSEPAVVEQLARELHSLRHGLADAGLKLGEQGINLMLSNQGGQQNQGQGNQGGQNAQNGNQGRGTGGGLNGIETANVVQNLSGWVSPDRVLDVNV